MAYLQLIQCKNIYTKKGLHHDKPSSIDDFDAVGEKRAVTNPGKFFREHGLYFYVSFADFKNGSLALVRPKAGIQMKEFPIFWPALREHADELLVIPFTELAAVAAEVADDVSHVTTVFLYHTTRCGSTLLIKALEASGLVHGVSEPDIHVTFLQYQQSQPGLQEEDLKMLTDVMGYSNTLFNFTLLQQDPSRTAVCYKTRAQAIHVAELLHKAIPEGKSVLLYRDVTGTVDSFLHLVTKSYWKYWLITALRLDVMLVAVMRFANRKVRRQIRKRDQRLMSAPGQRGFVWSMTTFWLEFMQQAYELTESKRLGFFNVVLRYKELRQYNEEMVLKVLEDLGIACKEEVVKEKIKAVFGVNSQAGTVLEGKFGTVSDTWVGDWEKGVISAIVDHVNMNLNQSDFVLRGTITEI